MANAFRCDRCKRFFDGSPAGTVMCIPADNDEHDHGSDKSQCCSACLADIQRELRRNPEYPYNG